MQLIKIKWFIQTRIKSILYGKIGKKTYVAKQMQVINRKNIYIGNRTRIYPNGRIEALNNGKIHIGDNVSIGQNAHIISHTFDLAIGNSTTISSNVFISNVNHSFEKINVSALEQECNPLKTEIGDYCFIGVGSIIMPGVKLGKNCIVGANSLVLKGVYPDYSVVVGSPARVIKKYDFDLAKWVNV